jgi:hypothetical protein
MASQNVDAVIIRLGRIRLLAANPAAVRSDVVAQGARRLCRTSEGYARRFANSCADLLNRKTPGGNWERK